MNTVIDHIVDTAVSDQVVEGLNREVGMARGLPNQAFTSQAFLDCENQTVFSRGWTFVGPASEVPNTGDVKPFLLAGRPLFMVRDLNDEIRVFQNVCPHRGTRLVAEPISGASVLTCPYHAWSYKLDGSLKGRPHYHGPGEHDFGNTSNNNNDRVCLFSVRSAIWHDWVFVNLDGEATAFEEYMAPAIRRYQGYNLDSFRRAKHMSFPFGCNWKLAVESFVDVYHVYKVHPGLDKMMKAADRFPTEPDGVHMFNFYPFAGPGHGLSIDAESPKLPELPGLSEKLRSRCNFCILFPNSAMLIYPTNLQFVTFQPVGPDECIMHMWFYFVEDAAQAVEHESARETVYVEWTDVNAEDEDVCRRVQLGRSCDAYDGGRLAPYWDEGTLHFHRQIAAAIRGEEAFKRPSVDQSSEHPKP